MGMPSTTPSRDVSTQTQSWSDAGTHTTERKGSPMSANQHVALGSKAKFPHSDARSSTFKSKIKESKRLVQKQSFEFRERAMA